MKRLSSLLALVVLVAACSSAPAEPAAPPPPPQLDPVGEYTFSLDVAGMALGGTMNVAGADGAWTGEISTEMGAMPMSAIEVDGMVMTFAVDIPEAYVSFVLEFDGMDFTGQINAEGMGSGSIAGSKR